mgnify:CR=1 FL=1
MTYRKVFRQFFLDPLEATPLLIVYGFLKIIPLEAASFFMGKVARFFGSWLPVSQVGRKNLKMAFPEKTSQEIEVILKGVWENMGRVIGELPHIEKISSSKKYLETVHLDILKEARDDQRPGIFFTAHLGSWELPHMVAVENNLPICLVGRYPNNWILACLVKKIRSHPLVKSVPKGAEGSKDIIRVLKNKGHLGLVIDQRLSEGKALSFFNHPALTAIGPARLAYKYKAPFIPTRVERLKGCKFRVTFYPPMKLDKTPEETMKEVNKIIEKWIREKPDQWLWLHNRWKP